jgi:signal transduction histidine kinase
MLNATVSHEMRGPIGSIQQNILVQERQIEEMTKFKDELKGELAALNREDETKKSRRLVKKWEKALKEISYLKANMKTGSKLLGFYVQDLLDLAQIRAGKIVKNVERVNVNEVLKEILQT